jgi:hypothetical protein
LKAGSALIVPTAPCGAIVLEAVQGARAEKRRANKVRVSKKKWTSDPPKKPAMEKRMHYLA